MTGTYLYNTNPGHDLGPKLIALISRPCDFDRTLERVLAKCLGPCVAAAVARGPSASPDRFSPQPVIRLPSPGALPTAATSTASWEGGRSREQDSSISVGRGNCSVAGLLPVA